MSRGIKSTRAAIVGVAESELGDTGSSILDLQAQAIKRALDDAGLRISDVDGLATNGVSRFSVSQVAEYMGIQPIWTNSSMAGGSSYEIFLSQASEAIKAGEAEIIVISYGSNQRSARSRKLGGSYEQLSTEVIYDVPFSPLYPISLYAMAAKRHFHEFGTTSEQLAEVAVSARSWAIRNPKAFKYESGEITIEDVLASPMVSSPLHTMDCCLVTDGGGAIVLTTWERARDLKAKPVLILGHGETSTHVTMSQIPDLTDTGAKLSAARAFDMAGVGPKDINVLEVYDSFTITVLLTLEALGYCKRGEGGQFLQDGKSRFGGSFPLNTSGGGLSYCHPGMFGIFLAIEAARQLRGESGERQVEGAELALCHGTGGILSTHSTVILGVD